MLPVQNSVMFFAGGIARPNGPFAANDQLAMVGALSIFFLLFLRAALGPHLTAGRRLLHLAGLAASLGTALMPMFRSVAITLLLALIIDTFWEQKSSRRAWRVVLTTSSIGLIFVAPLFLPAMLVQDRSGGDNLYGRLAQLKQSLHVFLDHPALGATYRNITLSYSFDAYQRLWGTTPSLALRLVGSLRAGDLVRPGGFSLGKAMRSRQRSTTSRVVRRLCSTAVIVELQMRSGPRRGVSRETARGRASRR